MFLAQAFVCVLHANELFIIINESDNIQIEVITVSLDNNLHINPFTFDKVRRHKKKVFFALSDALR
jgi:hypothetical protein